MTTIDQTTPMQRGNGRPVTDECTINDLRVTGAIPREFGRPVRLKRSEPVHWLQRAPVLR